MTMAQEPRSAKYSGMPESAVAANAVDYVMSPEKLPRRLMAYGRGAYLLLPKAMSPVEAALPQAMQKILLLLRNRNGHDFSTYKPTTIQRRIERRINIHHFKTPQEYTRLLEENPHELDLLFKEIFIGVTSFFRNPEAFEALKKDALPPLLEAKPDDSAVRVWVPGCSTGEEAYSLAILMRECLDQMKKRLTVQIFATDLDVEAIERARLGLYPDGMAMDVPPAQLMKHFIREEVGYRIRKAIRETVVSPRTMSLKTRYSPSWT
jgi:two-component system, chemotaxis family, CheB/CheR fusion protein